MRLVVIFSEAVRIQIMASFIKICPHCGHQNAAQENACTACTYYIGSVSPTMDSLTNPMPPTDSKRTFIASTLFLDIVGYSKRSVDDQLNCKRHFNMLISKAMTNIAEPDRVLLDTGDGAALCFLENPEEALNVAVRLLRVILSLKKTQAPYYQLYLGINLGPIKIMQDVNSQRNVLGDGINVAQRIVSFAKPNQLLVSRSFYELVVSLNQGRKVLFKYQGIHVDKHEREHEAYEFLTTKLLAQQSVRPKPTATPQAPNTGVVNHSATAMVYLEAACGSQVYPVLKGSVMGQAHPEGGADVQISDLEGCQYIHRQHCRFEYANQQWYIIPIDQHSLGRDFTNPTTLNGQALNVGKPHPLQHGDKLELAGVVFYVRVLE